ncbi:MAG: hypothetical protein H7Y22_12900 [Gemmatimonadaceae bacterium]|nr:hypothetical protein [Gloeobacterales cyanobacterium ES-bin-141]
MYTIEVILRGNPIALNVQRKEVAAAEELYKQLTEKIKNPQPTPIEMTCEVMTGKRVTVMSSDIAAVQMTSKASGSSGGVRAGFFPAPEG